ncbi:MAG TPA: hypothetical protein ENI27_02635 [bacterium]|nr:hypothetical protein [bacterium]
MHELKYNCSMNPCELRPSDEARSPLSMLVDVMVMVKRILTFSLALLILLPGSFSGWPQPEKIKRFNPGINLIHSDENGVVVDLRVLDYELEWETRNGKTYQEIIIPNAVLSGDPGKPQIPRYSALIGVPVDAKVELYVLSDEVATVMGRYTLPPAPRPAPLAQDLQPGRFMYEPDPAVYASLVVYPEVPARIAEEAWLRDQRIIVIELFPFQYIPATGQLIWHRYLQVEVSFNNGKAIRRDPEVLNRQGLEEGNISENPFETVLRNEILNYESAREWRGFPLADLLKRSALSQKLTESISQQVKIVVDRDGIYQLGYDELVSAGLDVGGLDPTTFHLTSQGQDVAIYVTGEEDFSFDQGDVLTFYGQKFRGDLLAQRYADEDAQWRSFFQQIPEDGSYTIWKPQFNATMLEKYTDENVYWLTYGATSGPRMGTIDGTPGDAQTPTSFRTTVRAEQSHEWKTTLFTSEDTWFWDVINVNAFTPVVTRTYTTTLSSPAWSSLGIRGN